MRLPTTYKQAQQFTKEDYELWLERRKEYLESSAAGMTTAACNLACIVEVKDDLPPDDPSTDEEVGWVSDASRVANSHRRDAALSSDRAGAVSDQRRVDDTRKTRFR